MFVNQTAVTPTPDQCSNGTGITAEYNSTVEFLVPGVAYNVTAVDPSASSGASATGSAKSAATRLEIYNSALFGLVFLGMCFGVYVATL